MNLIAMTGHGGFLGFHTRCAALEDGTKIQRIDVGDNFNLAEAVETIDSADTLIHLAGVNRGTEAQIREGNRTFAAQVSKAVSAAATPPRQIVYANSIHQSRADAYGEAKKQAASILAAAAERAGSDFIDIQLPNIFGEYGKPDYNSVVATFCHQIASGKAPTIANDSEIPLLHAQHAADALLGRISQADMTGKIATTRVSRLAQQLRYFSSIYETGTIPSLRSDFDRDLFNTYRSFTFPNKTLIHIERHSDSRGSFFEVVKNSGGTGQASFSTTAPGITRGNHFHRRKIERFTVLAGEAVISMRKLFTDQVYRFSVSGDEPVSIDMPTFVTHNITNTGRSQLFTMFWANELFDIEGPDTIPLEV